MFVLRAPPTAYDAVHFPYQAAGFEQELLGVRVRVPALLLGLLRNAAACFFPLAHRGEGRSGQLTAEVPLDVVQLAQVLPIQPMFKYVKPAEKNLLEYIKNEKRKLKNKSFPLFLSFTEQNE